MTTRLELFGIETRGYKGDYLVVYKTGRNAFDYRIFPKSWRITELIDMKYLDKDSVIVTPKAFEKLYEKHGASIFGTSLKSMDLKKP